MVVSVFKMAKSMLTILVAVCFMEITNQQQSKEIQLEAFKIAQSVEKQVTFARNLSARVETLLDRARDEYDDIVTSKIRMIESTLNITLQPFGDVILGALRTGNSGNNSRAIECVATASVYFGQVMNGVNKQVLDCQTKTRVQLSNFVSKLTSQYNAQGTAIFNALSDCPYSFLIETASELEEARSCYTSANTTIKAYISKISKELEESQVTLSALQGNSCLTLGIETAQTQAKAVVTALVACGKAAGEWLTDANVSVAIKKGYTSLEQYVDEARSSVEALNTKVKASIDKFNAVNGSVEYEFRCALQDILNHIVFVEEFLENTTNPSELSCLEEARAKYEINYNEEVFLARECLNEEKATYTDSNFRVAVKNLQGVLDWAAVNAATRCTSRLPLTPESVGKCFDGELYQLRDKVWGVLEDQQEVLSSADNLYFNGLYCLEYHSLDNGKQNLNELAECLNAEGIEFTFDQDGLVTF